MGRTLFEGDIGSGKSTILMAIEFAFFGLGSEAGASILKAGESEGEVRMLFDVDGSEYEVKRGLERKAGRVHQTEGFLRSPDGVEELSPTELKERMLEVLQFNELPDPKAQSWIYRYAVYTPQEEMKEVLVMNPELRLQILRRAFRIEDYKTAAENALEISRKLRGDIRELEGESMGIDDLKAQAEDLEKEEHELAKSLSTLERDEATGRESVSTIRIERDELHRQGAALEGLRPERKVLESAVREDERERAALEREAAGLEARIDKLAKAISENRMKPRPSRKTSEALKEEEKEAGAKVRRLTELKAIVESKLEDYETIMRKGVCPVCDRPAEAHDFVGKKMSKKQELEHLTRELASSERDLEKARDLQAGLERWKADKERQEGRRDEITRLRRDFAKRKELSAAKASKTAEARRRLEELDGQLSRLKDVATKTREADAKLQDAEETLRKVREKLASARERLDLRREKQAEVGIEIVAKESAGVRRDALKEHELWLGDYFVPTLQMIEKSALGSINQEFGSLFQRWFGMLLSDLDKEVRVDEQFTPIVSQGGYEQEVSYLSGGERTSVALAYRLALNTLAQRVSAAMKSNLLILDEPTDGFSKEQLGNVREVLDDVGCPQMIIVSHDRELESFADQIFRVKKSVGESAVEPGGT